ncbi:PhzF family phenazine biosynthesis protein [Plastoroseomonas arctica]|uniref:PhzF family phenazine biosynthesis protein n=1 Tax=Plastoroseomonas arctica TaxID=1509237 RepID=A0AAF1KKN2_9PROT|nr:PhzF family phenazine biosynthesis protein [Plastoroseomonas arctica]MBR0655379.1 PhzF family phenazine biosynthesis protein [Plastoroseomonas arctica]
MPTHPEIILLTIFPAAPGGGNLAPIIPDATGLSAEAMRAIAAQHGHESGFVLPPEDPASADRRFRFFVPEHEMEMCGHATLGAAWLLRQRGEAQGAMLRIETLSGPVRALFDGDGVEVTQPEGQAEPLLDREQVLAALDIDTSDLADVPVQNAATSRVKTLVPLRDLARLHALAPNPDAVRAACEAIGSTGLYPYALAGAATAHARQFPRNSGYPEDAATGIAATALYAGLRALAAAPPRLVVRQGEAMGRPSEMLVRRDPQGVGLRLSGRVEFAGRH